MKALHNELLSCFEEQNESFDDYALQKKAIAVKLTVNCDKKDK